MLSDLTVKKLRDIARAEGISRYSRMTRVELVNAILKLNPPKAKSPVRIRKRKAKSPVRKTSPMKAKSPVRKTSPMKAKSPVRKTSPVRYAEMYHPKYYPEVVYLPERLPTPQRRSPPRPPSIPLEYVTAESKYDTCMGWSDSERNDRVATANINLLKSNSQLCTEYEDSLWAAVKKNEN